MQIFVDLCAFPLMRSCFLGKEDNRLLLSQAHGKTSLNYLKTGLKGGQSYAKTRNNLQLGNYNKYVAASAATGCASLIVTNSHRSPHSDHPRYY